MNTPADYRDCAAECLRAMQLATSHDVKSMLLHMAQRWTELADRLEANISRASPSALEERGLADPAPEAG